MKNKDRVLSIRVEEELASYIEEQAREWNMSVSDTLRFMIDTFYLPIRSLRQAHELLLSFKEGMNEIQEGELKKVAVKAQETMKAMSELVDRNMLSTNQLIENYNRANEFVMETMRKNLKMSKEEAFRKVKEVMREREVEV